jgi:hypothetical protein
MHLREWAIAALAVGLCTAAADGGLRQAAQLVDRHYYETAAAALRSAADPNARFLLARAYLGNAALHRALQRSSLATGTRYLQKLVAQRGRDRSRLAALYYGEYLLESGKTEAGLAQLRAFLNDGGAPARYREIAQLRLAAAQARSAPALSQAKSPDPEVRSQAAAALVRFDAGRAQAVALVDGMVEAAQRRREALPMRALSNALEVYARAGESGKAFALLSGSNLGRPSSEETLGKSKVLRFYDPALLGSLARLYQGAGEGALVPLTSDARLKGVAGFVLAESYLDTERAAQAATLLATLAAGELPAGYRERASVLQAAAEARAGKPRKGAALAELGQRHAADPALLAEVLSACLRARAACDGVVIGARQLAASGQGERFRRLHEAVGRQYLAARQTERALLALETARDKANKNKIDANDPLLLVTLADLYLETKSFSENLEIYFELSKEFPAVRQLQEMGQGIYSMEYRSAGDVKIF